MPSINLNLTQSHVLTDVFNLMPGLVIEDMGLPGVVFDVERDADDEVVTFSIVNPDGERTVQRSWGRGDTVRLIGLCVQAQLGQGDHADWLDALDLFNS